MFRARSRLGWWGLNCFRDITVSQKAGVGELLKNLHIQEHPLELPSRIVDFAACAKGNGAPSSIVLERDENLQAGKAFQPKSILYFQDLMVIFGSLLWWCHRAGERVGTGSIIFLSQSWASADR